jgi:hypothetical protein
MSDIVERLHTYATTASYGSDLREAADEIKRLRALLKGALYHVATEGDDTLAFEIRRALEEVKP